MLDGWPVLQVALDYEELSEALEMAKILRRMLEDVPWLCEAGTPLVKNEGLKKVVPCLRSIVGGKVKIVADLKTLDAGAFEVELVYKAGADIAVVAGAAEKETIEAALSKAKDLRITVMIDSIGVGGMEGRLEWIVQRIGSYNREGGSAVLEYHIPIDRQAEEGDFTPIERIYRQSRIPIAVAGGLDEKIIPKVLNYGAKIVIVGGSITRPKGRSREEALLAVKKAVYRRSSI